jgi:hypothetical protein
MYSSDDVIKALKCSHDLEFQGIDMVKRPRPDVIDGDTRCVDKSYACTRGREQNCKQHVHIFRKGALLRIVEFRFMRSPTDASGFIKCDDSALKSLLRNNIISL